MKLRTLLQSVLLGASIAVTSCSHYSTATKERPSYRSSSPAGQMIAQTLKHSSKEPQVQIGHYLDAVAAAGALLATNPANTEARADYNFAVGRIFEIINDAGLEPWKAPLLCQGVSQVWNLSINADDRPQYNPANYRFVPADRYKFKGRLVVQQSQKEGLGAPLVVVSKVPDATKIDPFAQGKHAYYGMTGIIEIKGNNCTAILLDPLSTEIVGMAGQTYPLAGNFTAAIALALAELKPRKKELGALFKPDEVAGSARLARLQPYDPKKIPILCVHGLGDSQATWAPMIESLRSDPVIRQNYQVWFFSYTSGYPYPLSASILRKQMDKINAHYPDHKKIVVLGHSMGGMISRTLMTDSSTNLWDVYYDKPPGEMPFTEETRRVMSDSLIFKPRSEIDRVIFLSPSHRGADLATNFFGKLGSKLIGGPNDMVDDAKDVLGSAKPNATGEHLKKMPNSIDFLNPENRFVTTLAKLPLTPGVPYHSILGDRGKGGNRSNVKPVSSDGIVPYWSSHLDGAESEIIIPSHHWTNQHPQGIAEVRRILHLHLGKQ